MLGKRIIGWCLFCILLSFKTFGGVISIDGTYQGDNIYIQNPYNSADNTYCITEVLINDQPFKAHANSAFEIPLNNYSVGQYVNIKITHKDNCKPRVLNPEVLRSKSTFEMVTIKADEKHVKWTTKGETSQEPFIVEQFRNNKWVPAGKVPGKGPEGFNNYSVEVNHHSGANKYRIKQRDLGDKYVYKDPIDYTSSKPPITFYPKRVDKELYFSESTEFEVYDSFGSLVKKGQAKVVDLAGLEPGIYYLNIDNKTEKFLKK